MNPPSRSLLGDLQTELGGLASDAREMVRLRLELARMEIQADINNVKHLGFALAAACAMVFTALPLLAVSLAKTLAGCWGISERAWLLIFAFALLIFAAACAYGGWLRFRRRFVGLQETLEELREDLEWIRESRGSRKGPGKE
jgi:uncharacterized membrane protein YqjE